VYQQGLQHLIAEESADPIARVRRKARTLERLALARGIRTRVVADHHHVATIGIVTSEVDSPWGPVESLARGLGLRVRADASAPTPA